MASAPKSTTPLDQRLRIAPFDVPFNVSWLGVSVVRRSCALRNEDEIDRLLDLIGQRLERDHAVLPDRRRYHARDVQAPRPAAAHVKARFEPRQVAQSRDPRDRGAHGGVGDKIEMLPGLGDIVHRNGNLPGRGREIFRLWL